MEGPRRVVVLGAGAIGGSVGGLLFDLGVPCVLVARGSHAQAMANHGVELRFPKGARRVRAPVVTDLGEARPCVEDLVLLATMGQDTDSAIGALDSNVTVVSFQNGVSPLESIARRGHPTLAAMVYMPGERRAPGVIALSGAPVIGSILLGRWPQGRHSWNAWLADRLSNAGFHAEVESDIAPWIRAKLLTNLGGIVVALCDVPARDVIDAAQAEARAVWRATGQYFVDIPDLMRRVRVLETKPIDGQARVGGSTRAALARGDALETASLHRGIVDGGRLVSIPTPINEALIRLAEQAYQERWRPGSMDPQELRSLIDRK